MFGSVCVCVCVKCERDRETDRENEAAFDVRVLCVSTDCCGHVLLRPLYIKVAGSTHYSAFCRLKSKMCGSGPCSM